MALNIKTFVRTGDLFPGGATGLTLLFQRAARMFFHVEIPYTVLNVAINAVPVYIGFRFIGKKFTLFSGLSSVLTSVLTDILPGYAITSDTLLISDTFFYDFRIGFGRKFSVLTAQKPLEFLCDHLVTLAGKHI